MKKLFVFLIFLAACDKNADFGGSAVASDLLAYTNLEYVDRTDPTIVTIINSSQHSVSVGECTGTIYYVRQKWVDDVWVDWTSASCDITAARVIEPGAFLKDSIRVRKPGLYRFRYELTIMNSPASVVMVYTNPFEIY